VLRGLAIFRSELVGTGGGKRTSALNALSKSSVRPMIQMSEPIGGPPLNEMWRGPNESAGG
jgi:hypothetical protein